MAVTEDGARIGKGEGYSDLEFAVLREFDLVAGDTPTATTVHGMQVVDEGVDIEPHDVSMYLIVTSERTIRTEAGEKPAEIDWSLLSEERPDEIPVLRRLGASSRPSRS